MFLENFYLKPLRDIEQLIDDGGISTVTIIRARTVRTIGWVTVFNSDILKQSYTVLTTRGSVRPIANIQKSVTPLERYDKIAKVDIEFRTILVFDVPEIPFGKYTIKIPEITVEAKYSERTYQKWLANVQEFRQRYNYILDAIGYTYAQPTFNLVGVDISADLTPANFMQEDPENFSLVEQIIALSVKGEKKYASILMEKVPTLVVTLDDLTPGEKDYVLDRFESYVLKQQNEGCIVLKSAKDVRKIKVDGVSINLLDGYVAQDKDEEDELC